MRTALEISQIILNTSKLESWASQKKKTKGKGMRNEKGNIHSSPRSSESPI